MTPRKARTSPSNGQQTLVGEDGRPLRVVFYVRASDERQDVENSLRAQEEELRKYTKDHGGIEFRIYRDGAQTGTNDRRPGLQQLLADSAPPKNDFDVVLLWKGNRLAREEVDSLMYKRLLRRRGLTVISLHENFDESPTGLLMETVMAGIDAFYSRSLGEDVSRGMEILARRGFYVGSIAPYGMRKKPVEVDGKVHYKLEPNPDTSWIVEKMFSLAETTGGIIGVVRGLKAEGIPNVKGETNWAPSSVHRVLTNEHLTGTIVYKKQSDGDYTVRVPEAHQELIPLKRFEALQKKMNDRAPTEIAPAVAGSRYLLSGLDVCQQCGAKVNYRSGKSGKYIYLVCNTRHFHGIKSCDTPRLPKEATEELVIRTILEDILVEENLRRLFATLSAEQHESGDRPESELESLNKKLNDNARRQDRVQFAYEDGKMNVQKYWDRMQQLETEHKSLTEQQASLKDSVGTEDYVLANEQEVLTHAHIVNRYLREEDPSGTRQILRQIVKTIWVGTDELIIEYRIPLPRGTERQGTTRRRLALDGPVLSFIHAGPPHQQFLVKSDTK